MADNPSMGLGTVLSVGHLRFSSVQSPLHSHYRYAYWTEENGLNKIDGKWDWWLENMSETASV